MTDLRSEVIIDCRIGKTDLHSDIISGEQRLTVQFEHEHYDKIRSVLPNMRFFPDITNKKLALRPFDTGYLLSVRERKHGTVLCASISDKSWPTVASITPGFTTTDCRAALRPGEIVILLPGPSLRQPPRAMHNRDQIGPHHRAPQSDRVAPGVLERVAVPMATILVEAPNGASAAHRVPAEALARLLAPNVETQASIYAWQLRTFGPCKSVRVVFDRIAVELKELGDALHENNLEKIKSECADVNIMLLAVCSVLGFNLGEAVNAKMAINRERKWKTAGEMGKGQHIEEDDA